MGRARTIARRTFLIGSAAIAGGVAFGTYLAKRRFPNPLEQGLGVDEASFNPYVKITPDRIVLVAPHADLGQGVRAMQVLLMAEELDIDPDQAEVTFGQPAQAYYNTATAHELAPFMAFDDSLPARTTRAALVTVSKTLGLMATGGSSSVPDCFDKMREAGAVARETLKRAAADLHEVPVADLRTARGAVLLPDGMELPYTALAAQAAITPPVTDVALRAPADWRLIGKAPPRGDILPKSTGTQTYGIDLQFDGIVHAAIRLNPYRGGAMEQFDTADADAMRGVRKIVAVQGRIWEQSDDGAMSWRRGPIGVAAIADNTWRAMQAVEAIDVTWAQGHYPPETAQHWQAVEDSFIPDRLDMTWRDDGDAAAALDASEVVEAEYRAPYVAHAPLEPLGAVVRVSDDGAELWAGHQVPLFLQRLVADALGVDPDRVVFHNQFAGGSFGHRLEVDFVLHAVEIARQMPGVPVKLTFSREEDFAQDFPRQISMARGRGAVAGGRVDALAMDVASVSVAASQARRLDQALFGPDPIIPAGLWNMPFAIPNLRVRAYKVPDLAPVSSWRSVGASTAGFFGESFLDELCHAASADPMEERLRLVNHPVHRKVLEAVAEMSGWGGDPGPGRGRGVAMVESFGVPASAVVQVQDTGAGLKVERAWIAADVGRVIDPVNVDAQLQGGLIWGLGHAMNCEITYAGGVAQQTNYHAHEGMRLHQCPAIETRALENGDTIRGIGEPGVPPAAPALANAIFAATGQRLREMPFGKFVAFL